MVPTLLLLVEDEGLIATDLDDALVAEGFTVLHAASGTKAIDELESDASRFNAVVTDIKLGKGADGWEVAKRARELVPNIPVVYVSADSSGDWTSKGVPHSVMIAKPFLHVQIITAIAILLNKAEGGVSD